MEPFNCSPLLLAREISSILWSQKCKQKMEMIWQFPHPSLATKYNFLLKPIVHWLGTQVLDSDRAGFESLLHQLLVLWLWTNYVNSLNSVSSSGKCKTHNSTCFLGLLWGQMTNACEMQSTVSDMTCYYQCKNVSTPQGCYNKSLDCK